MVGLLSSFASVVPVFNSFFALCAGNCCLTHWPHRHQPLFRVSFLGWLTTLHFVVCVRVSIVLFIRIHAPAALTHLSSLFSADPCIVAMGGSTWSESDNLSVIHNAEIFDSNADCWTWAQPAAPDSVPASSAEEVSDRFQMCHNSTREAFAGCCLTDDNDQSTILVCGGDQDYGLRPGRARPNPASLHCCELWSPFPSPGWRPTRDLLLATDRYGHSCVSIGSTGRALVTGGFVEHGASRTVECFDFHSETWSIMASMSLSRHYHASAYHPVHNRIYVACGSVGLTKRSCESYDVETNFWMRQPDCLFAHPDHPSAAFLAERGIFILAGIGGNMKDGSAEQFDERSGAWMRLADLHWPRSFPSSVMLNGEFILLGGQIAPNACTSSIAKDYLSQHGHRSHCCLALPTMESYDLRANQWLPMKAEMKMGRFAAVSMTVQL